MMSEISKYIFVLIFLTYQFSKVECVQQYSYQFNNKNGYENREELVIGNVTSYDRFEFGRNVFKWKSVTIQGKNYAVGLMTDGICVFTAEIDSNNTLIVRNSTDFTYKAVDVDLVKYWNGTTKSYEPILILVAKNSSRLKWCKISDTLQLVNIWNWNLRKQVVHINLFKVDNIYHLLVMKNQTYYIADIYRIKLEQSYAKHFWLSQSLPLKYSSQTSTFTTHGFNNFLAIPQNDMVCIFKYEEDRFISFLNISSPNIDYINSFSLGLDSYLLINGKNAGIYKFNTDNLIKENIEDLDFIGINFWLPLKVTTYKDEIILLGERILDHEGHKSKRIEVIMRSGDKFYLHEEIPCRYYGDLLSGIDCLVEEENHNHSLKGSTSLKFDKMLGIVVPRRNMASGLFLLHIDTRLTPSPIMKRINELKSLRSELEKMIEKRQQTIQEIQTRLKMKNTKLQKQTEPKPLVASAVQSVKYNSSSARFSDSDTLSRYETRANLLQNDLENVQELLKTAVRRDARIISVEDLVLKDIVAVKGSSRIGDLKVEKISNTTADALFTDFVRIGDKMPITAEKTFQNLELEELDVEVINKQDVRNMAFKKESEVLELNGDFIFTNVVEVTDNVTTSSGKINEHTDLSQALTIDDSYEEEIHFENVDANHLQAQVINKLQIPVQYIDNAGEVDEMDNIEDAHYIPGNLTVENINGQNLQDILDSICMKNEKIVIYGKITVDGVVNVTETIDTTYLNGLRFPEDYIFSERNKSGGYIHITGDKHFETAITTNTLTTSGLVNGIDVSTIILREGNMSIPGSFTFTNLTVNGELEVKGNITGADMLSNPTIEETNVLNAILNFNVLEIEGTVTVKNSVNGSRLDQVLTDVIYKNEKEANITSVKDFKGALTIEEDMKVESNKINGISLDSFVNKISEQSLNVNVLNGDVVLKHLFITGFFDGINITQLNEETVKLSGEQFISSSLTFFDDVHIAGDFKINGTLNDLTPDSYIYKTGDRILPNLNILGDIEVDSLTVEGNFKGKISNFDLDTFNMKRLSLSRDQHVTGKYFVKNLEVENLNASKINNYDYRDLIDENRHHALLLDKILKNQVIILEMNVVGNASIKSINGIHMEDILKTCFYRGENTLKPSIAFENAEFNRITIDSINNIPFQVFMDNLIFKNETNVIFDEPVFFLEGFEVAKFIETESINLIPLKNFLRKSGNQEVMGPLVIKGDVTIESDIVVGEDLNGIPLRYLQNAFEVIDDNTYKINDEVVFETYTYINDLFVDGYINQIKWPEFLNRVVRRKDDAIIPGVIHFINQVQIKGDLGIMHGINNNDLSKFVEDMIFITYDAYIQGLVSFAQPVYIEEELIIESDLWCDTIMGIDVRNWPRRAVTFEEGKIRGQLNFEDVNINGFIVTNYINNINMSTLIPLRTEQFIPEALYFEEMTITQEIKVDNLVNNIKLEPEFANTLLIEGDQEISSEIEFTNNVVVYGDLITSNLVNGFDLNKIVTLNTDQNLTAEYIFEGQTFMHSNLHIHGLVNGINILEWKNKALMKEKENVQTIEVPLNVGQNLTFANNLFGNQSIASLNVDRMANTIQAKKNFKENEEKQIIGGFSSICDNVNYLLHKAKSQIYKFKYFEYFQSIQFNNEIGIIHNFQHENIHYMLVNEVNSCISQLFSWSASGYTLIRNDIETGNLLQIITVKDKSSSLYFVGRSVPYSTCLITGTNIWKFENVQEMLHIYKLEDLLLLEISKIPGTFYGSSLEFVHEFNIQSQKNSHLRRLRKWRIDNTDNLAYMPHNLGTGLALRDGQRILKLLKETDITQLDYDYNLEETAVENIIEESNSFVPGRNDGEFIALNVGKIRVRTLTAITHHEDTIIKGKFDSIRIYEDIFNGEVFHKIWTYKPSSLTSMEFGNGETLLGYLENGKLIQIYEYKGIEGFKLRSTIEQEGQKLMSMKLPKFPRNNLKNMLAVVNHDKLILMEAIMDGDSVNEDYLQCTLSNL